MKKGKKGGKSKETQNPILCDPYQPNFYNLHALGTYKIDFFIKISILFYFILFKNTISICTQYNINLTLFQ